MTVSDEIEALLNDGSQPATPEQVKTALDKLGIENSTISHEPMRTVADSKALRDSADGSQGGHAKNLFLRNKKGEMVLVTLQEDREIDLDGLGKSLSVGKLSFASPERLMKYLGVRPGAVTPLAVLNDKEVAVTAVLDKALLDEDPLHFHPCVNSQTTTVPAIGLVKYMSIYHAVPRIIDFDNPDA